MVADWARVWATVDIEGFAIVSTLKRLEYLLWNGAQIYSIAGPATFFTTASGKAVLDDEGLFRIRIDSRDLLWICEVA